MLKYFPNFSLRCSYAKFFLSFVLFAVFLSCEKSETNEQLLIESTEIPDLDFTVETVSMEEAMAVVDDWKNLGAAKSGNPIDLTIDGSSYRTEELTNTDAKLAVLSADSKYEGLLSEVWQLRYEGKLLKVLMHTYESGHGSDGIYNGLSIITDFEGQILTVYDVKNSKVTSEIAKKTDSSGKMGTITGRCWGFHCPVWTLDEVIVYPTGPNYIHTTSPWIGNGHIFTGINPANQYRGYNWGAQYAYSALSNITFPTKAKKVDPKKELKCFKSNQGGKLTIYVQQPKEKSDNVLGPNQVGHAFVGIQQGSNHKLLGFYPPSSASQASIAVGTKYKSEIRDNSGTLYHVSISTNVTASQMNNILNYVRNFPSTYELNSYACADFAIRVGNLGGLNLPSTTVEYFTFKGRSPGKLGEQIRAMNSDSKKTIKKTKGTSPTQSKTKC